MNSPKKKWDARDIAYCSNVHAGESAAQICENLRHYIEPVRQQRGLASMATGLWISASAARELKSPQLLTEFQQALETSGLQLTSINGFPYGGFHQQEVKAKVYLPDWSDQARLRYTKDLADILAACLPDDCDCGAISTLPLGYKRHWSSAKQRMSIAHLSILMQYLDKLYQRTGKKILVCLEMEPDCVLESSVELVDFFQNQVQPHILNHQYLAVCYDVCHQAVMHEDAKASLQQITDADIPIGKIQLSSALKAQFAGDDSDGRLLSLLSQFCEPKYLHQVKSRTAQGELLASNDLLDALTVLSQENAWRVHFHVPIHAETLMHPQLHTTRDDLLRVFDFLAEHPDLKPWLEVETYSWQVLPQGLCPVDDAGLIAGIVNELNWVVAQLAQRELIKK